MPVNVCVLLWAHPGQNAALTSYEDKVLKLVAEHDGRVLQRGQIESGTPAEVQIIQFASQAAADAYMNDPRRLAMAAERDAAVARTDVHPIRLL